MRSQPIKCRDCGSYYQIYLHLDDEIIYTHLPFVKCSFEDAEIVVEDD